MPSLSAAALGEIDLRICAAEGRQRYGRGCAEGRKAAGESECEGQFNRAESRTGDSIFDAFAGAGFIFSGNSEAGNALLCQEAQRARRIRGVRAVEEDGERSCASRVALYFLVECKAMVQATLSSKNQIVIPKEAREALGLKPGD